jgi:hypothetical protein
MNKRGRRNCEEKLIIVALPLVAIDKVAAREKFSSQRHRSAGTIAKVCCPEVRV